MADFLPALRANRAGNSRPFGMPNIDGGGLSTLLREILPVANSLKDDDMRRDQEMMQFQASLRNRPMSREVPQDKLINRPSAMRSGALGAAPGAPAGFSPMQKQMQGRDAEDRGNAFKMGALQAEQKGRLTQAMEEGKMRDAGAMDRLTTELNTREKLNTADNTSREKNAETAARAHADDRTARAAEGQSDRLSRERIAGMPPRALPRETPVEDQILTQVQNFKVQNPELADRVIFDETSKTWKLNTQGLTPEQLAGMQERLTVKPKAAGPKMITQRNKKTGETRQVPAK